MHTTLSFCLRKRILATGVKLYLPENVRHRPESQATSVPSKPVMHMRAHLHYSLSLTVATIDMIRGVSILTWSTTLVKQFTATF